MMDDLTNHVEDEIAFRDRLPYVLDLLAGVTRRINEESKGRRTKQFDSWWQTTDRQMQASIQELRHAELKRAESRARPKIRVDFTPDPRPVTMDTDARIASRFSIDVSTEWHFTGGGNLDGTLALPVLAQYWKDLVGVLSKAETLLGVVA